eukprot:CAMPEP_0118915870 /NCGR_PEP_ID=MMETSP1166-20130328/15982_1 /TAXON_ID=1104430 /ORGANISM="Chrysoreinhardia sp, Strain CCMP3193" /LENGTH=78 /DNA_ID=CAMNT_0006855631 /DNA_START=12 /DNA_END=244 /DNA_ORIENTATION=+
MAQRRVCGGVREERAVGVFLLTEAVNLCPEEEEENSGGGELYLSYGDTVRLAQTSPRVAAAINWIKVEGLAANEVCPR